VGAEVLSFGTPAWRIPYEFLAAHRHRSQTLDCPFVCQLEVNAHILIFILRGHDPPNYKILARRAWKRFCKALQR
jgi:hypothetical protein